MTPREMALKASSPPIPALLAALGWLSLGWVAWDWRRKGTDW